MGQSNLNLAALIGSRICHDLISPIGAIDNGIELLGLAGGGEGPELALIADSCASANARIRFFRVAFGAASGRQTMARREIMSILEGVAAGGRHNYIWAPEADLLRREVQLGFLALLCLETALPHGGTARADFDGEAWRIGNTDGTARIDAAIWDALSDPEARAELSPAQVQFGLLPVLAADLGRLVRQDCHGGRAIITV